jgi:DNA-binding CsgD family transcriptional regulator
VAQQLHVTPHTVKAHLHNAFAKLGINSRAELSRLMDSSEHPTI